MPLEEEPLDARVKAFSAEQPSVGHDQGPETEELNGHRAEELKRRYIFLVDLKVVLVCSEMKLD